MREWLRTQGHPVNHKRVSRLMQVMGLEAIYPKPRLSQSNEQHRKYPYLLKGVKIETPNHVWSTDITYIRLRQGFVYLVAILDWFSRYVLSWKISLTMEVEFCLEALEMALKMDRPVIFNSDQVRNSPVWSLRVVYRRKGFTLAWMGEAECLIISS